MKRLAVSYCVRASAFKRAVVDAVEIAGGRASEARIPRSTSPSACVGVGLQRGRAAWAVPRPPSAGSDGAGSGLSGSGFGASGARLLRAAPAASAPARCAPVLGTSGTGGGASASIGSTSRGGGAGTSSGGASAAVLRPCALQAAAHIGNSSSAMRAVPRGVRERTAPESLAVERHHACGRRTRNVVPLPGVDCTSISPSCICTVR